MDHSSYVKYLSSREARYRAILLLRIIRLYKSNIWCESQLKMLGQKLPQYNESFDSLNIDGVDLLIENLMKECPLWDSARNPLINIPKYQLNRFEDLPDAVATVDTDWTMYLLGEFKYTPFQIRDLGLSSINPEQSIQNSELIDLLNNLYPGYKSTLEIVELAIADRLTRILILSLKQKYTKHTPICLKQNHSTSTC